METLAYILTAIIGLIIGSFLNVVIYRVPEKKSIVRPASACPNCGEPIKRYDNIPVISYLVLRGKCRNCGNPISIQYPLVEVSTSALAVLSLVKFGITASFLLAAFFLIVLLTVTVIDLQRQIIPNAIIIPTTAVAGVLAVSGEFTGPKLLPLIGTASVIEAVIGFIGGGGLLLLIALLWKGGMGGGDIKLAAFMGIFLGRYVIMALFIGFLVGAVAGVISIAMFQKSRRDLLPFGPFLSLGAVVTLFLGTAILNWYLTLSGLA